MLVGLRVRAPAASDKRPCTPTSPPPYLPFTSHLKQCTAALQVHTDLLCVTRAVDGVVNISTAVGWVAATYNAATLLQPPVVTRVTPTEWSTVNGTRLNITGNQWVTHTVGVAPCCSLLRPAYVKRVSIVGLCSSFPQIWPGACASIRGHQYCPAARSGVDPGLPHTAARVLRPG